MTCIGWDGTTLAADTLGIIGGTLKIESHKIFRLPHGALYGGSGNYDDVLAVKEWLEHGGEKPKVTDFSGLVITADGRCFRLHEALVHMPITEKYHAVGSGRDFALAAMALGKTAREAVELAMQFDVATGGMVEVLAFEETEEDADLFNDGLLTGEALRYRLD